MIDTLTINTTLTSHSRLAEIDFDHLQFGKIFSDHMFMADYEGGEWKNFQILPYGPIPMSPAISALHYGQAIFEGMKAYRLHDGNISVFRADKNFERFNISAARMAMPTIPEEIFMQGIAALIQTDAAWIPTGENTSLYLRPVMFATDTSLGVRASDTYKFVVLATPAGPYYNKALKVKIETHFTRANQGGVGYAKTAGNYARSLHPFSEAQKEGFDQLIWTDAQTHQYVEESGAANLMFVIDGKIVTAATGDTILNGVTRRTIIELAEKNGIVVEERKVSIAEIIAGIQSGALTEAFAVGTAATVTQIGEIGYEQKLYTLNPVENRTISIKLASQLNEIRYGLVPDEFGWNWIL
ncbi:MAG: branched-chain amino acid aminotransferase [Pedobacter sp.]|nr:MAG: branched-chain amino acid aminotransferase [Pedobacter sp.]